MLAERKLYKPGVHGHPNRPTMKMAMSKRTQHPLMRPWRVIAVLILALAITPAVWGMSLNQAVQQVQQQTGGRVLSAETVRQGGRLVHRIKVLTPSGQVRVVTVDAGRR